jgi:hypothetical protein
MKARPQRRSGNFAALKVEVWAAIRAASALLDDPETTPELRLRAVSAVATAGAVYAKLLEATPDDDAKPDTPSDIIVIRSPNGSNGHHA